MRARRKFDKVRLASSCMHPRDELDHVHGGMADSLNKAAVNSFHLVPIQLAQDTTLEAVVSGRLLRVA